MSQLNAILQDLKQGQQITPMDALQRHGCLRLAARISDLRHAGHSIDTVMIEVGRKKFVAGYRLAK